MTVNPELENLSLRVVRTVYQTYTRFENCLDGIVRAHGLTAERYLVLLTVKYHDAPVRISDIALWGERSINSVSMIVDRMVRTGLVKKIRVRSDRRVVNVSLTSKGENAVGPATPASWELIQKILSPLSYENKQALAGMLETVRCEAVSYLNPKVNMAEIVQNSLTNQPDLYERMVKTVFPSGSEPVVRMGKKKRPYNKDG